MSLIWTDLYKQIPAILVVFPLLVSLVVVIAGNKVFAKCAFALSNILLFMLSLIAFFHGKTIHYFFGSWNKPVGIEFKLGALSIVAVGLIYFVSSIFSSFLFKSFSERLESLILPGRKHIPYALFLLVEAGYAGIILTNDIFNFYVFLEIASLASYPLIAISANNKSLIAAFEYLVIGTVASTIMLVSIGIMLALVGSLNLMDIEMFFMSHSLDAKFVVVFLLVGALVKVAIFPFHSWKIKSYSFTSNIIACFFISISSIAAILILVKFKFLINLISSSFSHYICLVGFVSIIFGSISSYFEDNYGKLIVYSSISSVGYYLILWPYESEFKLYLFLQILMLDSLVKLAILIFPLALSRDNLSVRQLIGLAKNNSGVALILIFLLINAACMPPTLGFFNKLSIIRYFGTQNILYVPILSLSSLFSTLAYLRIARQLVKNSDIENSFKIDRVALSAIFLIGGILLYGIFTSSYIRDLAKIIFEGS